MSLRQAPALETTKPHRVRTRAVSHSEFKLVRHEPVRRVERFPIRFRVIALTIGAIAILFGLVAFHVVLSQGQFRLEKMARAATAQQDQYQRLRLQVAELESPNVVTATARDRLGMVTPSKVTPVTPTAADLPKGLPIEDLTAMPSQNESDATSFDEWSRVKSLVSSSAP